MTTATGPVSRRRVRTAAAAAGLACALALTACSGDSDSDDDSSATPSTSASASGSASSSSSASGKLEGSWLATTDGKAVVLMVDGKGGAGLFATGGTVCSGTATEGAGMQMIRLKCTDGSKDRATGMVDSVGTTTLKVTWENGLGTETYTKAEGGSLPSGLPTASLGS